MPIEIGMLLFPDLTQLDLTGPFEMLHRVPDATRAPAVEGHAPGARRRRG